MRGGRLVAGLGLVATLAGAPRVSRLQMGAEADDRGCAVSKQGERFEVRDAQVFVSFQAGGLRRGDVVGVEWIEPGGQVALRTSYPAMPAAAQALCFVTQMPVAGFAAASRPGRWKVRVLANDAGMAEGTFTIEGAAERGAATVTGVEQVNGEGRTRLRIAGSGFHGESVVNIARYTASGGWNYLHHLLAEEGSAERLEVSYPTLEAGEYMLLVSSPTGGSSLPFRLAISTNGYKLPTPAGVPWVVTQGPRGGFSHWGNSLHAYDIAPRGNAQVVAMRGGIVTARDLGLRQNLRTRGFGNYVTIDHGDGFYSHYAHLLAGSVRVRTGDIVQQGQALATAGSSGYSFGTHLHVHVTRGEKISSQSIPFVFEEFAQKAPRAQTTVVSSNHAPGAALAMGGAPAEERGEPPEGPAIEKRFEGTVAVEQWWTEQFTVPKNSRSAWVHVMWSEYKHTLELYLTSPSGRQFGPGAEEMGFTPGRISRRWDMTNPEAGLWRMSVIGTRGSHRPMTFRARVSVNTGPVRKR